MSQKQLADKLDINRSTLADYETGTYEPSIDKLNLFANYFKVSVDYLVNENQLRSSGHYKQELKVLAITVDSENKENIELVPDQAKAGYLEGYKDPEYIKSLPKFCLPNFSTGTYRGFEIGGDSMPPINDGFIVIGKYVESWKDLQDHKRYVLITRNEGIVFKRIRGKPSTEEIMLYSDNLAYSSYSVKIDEIIEIWSFCSFIGFPEDYHSHVVEDIFAKLETIDDKIEKLVNN